MEQLAQMSEREILALRGIGQKTLREIVMALARCGTELAIGARATKPHAATPMGRPLLTAWGLPSQLGRDHAPVAALELDAAVHRALSRGAIGQVRDLCMLSTDRLTELLPAPSLQEQIWDALVDYSFYTVRLGRRAREDTTSSLARAAKRPPSEAHDEQPRLEHPTVERARTRYSGLRDLQAQVAQWIASLEPQAWPSEEPQSKVATPSDESRSSLGRERPVGPDRAMERQPTLSEGAHPVEALGPSCRAQGAPHKDHVRTVDEMAQLTDGGILAMRAVADTRLQEIDAALEPPRREVGTPVPGELWEESEEGRSLVVAWGLPADLASDPTPVTALRLDAATCKVFFRERILIIGQLCRLGPQQLAAMLAERSSREGVRLELVRYALQHQRNPGWETAEASAPRPHADAPAFFDEHDVSDG